MKGLNDGYLLRNGVSIPCVGFGTFRTPDGEICVEAVKEAIRCGYRHIDTASVYGNEVSVGKAVRDSGVDRGELFITSKLWNDDQGYDAALRAFEASLKRLGTDYLDLYLIHWPVPAAHREDWQRSNLDSWRALERLYKEGRIRAIGVSNFLRHHLEPLMSQAEIPPMVNQVELHPQYPQEETVAFCRENGIVVESWGPLIQGKAFELPLLRDIAGKYGRTVAQICIRWSLQKGILPLPKSINSERIASNAQVFDFVIASEDMERMEELSALGRVGNHPDSISF